MKEKYYLWLLEKVDSHELQDRNYNILLSALLNTPFIAMMDMDINRVSDGLALRQRFCGEKRCGQRSFDILKQEMDEQCSILELMVALSIRCEDSIMSNPKYGDRTGYWFWQMIESLGLSDQDDEFYDEFYVKKVIDKFIERKYKRDGYGSLYWVPRTQLDFREIEIWYQMMRFLDEYN